MIEVAHPAARITRRTLAGGLGVSVALIVAACGPSGPPPPEQVAHTNAVGAPGGDTGSPWTELSLVLYAEGGRLATVSVPVSDYQAALGTNPGALEAYPNDLQLEVAELEATADVSCPDGGGAPCRETVLVPTHAAITITFHQGLDPYPYPVSGTGASCEAEQSVWNDFIASAQNPKASFDIACHIRVAGAVTVKGQWRSGRGEYCWDKPGNAPPPGPATMWIFSVADFPASPPPYPSPANVPPCANLPPTDPLANQVGPASP